MTDDTARQLWSARVDNTKLPSDFAGDLDSEAAAYRLQSEMISASGQAVIGWKIGATAEALFGVLGVTQPFIGPLFEAFTYRSGDEIEIAEGRSIETEITLRLGADLPFSEEARGRAEVEAVVAAIIPSFEIVGARFEGGLAGAGFRLIADGGANVGTVLGDEIADRRQHDLVGHPIELFLDGRSAVQGNTSALLWEHVFDALAWLARQPAMAPRGLLAGDIVMTGTCTGITPIAKGTRASASFGAMGEIRATFGGNSPGSPTSP